MFTFLMYAMYISKPVLAGAGSCGGQPGFSFAQKKGIEQGWLVSYNGDNQSFAGIPCKYKDATQEELNKIIENCCGGSSASGCLDKATLSNWESSYPTCSKRNLEVRKNDSGKFEAFDIARTNPDPTITTSNSNSQQNLTPIADDKRVNIIEKKISWIVNVFKKIVSWIKKISIIPRQDTHQNLNNTNIQPTTQKTIRYSVKVESSSKVMPISPNDVKYKVKIENISTEPYITNFAFYECEFKDSTNQMYKGKLMTETKFDKAVLIGESQTISITSQANLDGYDNTLDGFKKCEYGQNGENKCTIVKDLSVKSCTAYITSNGKQSSNGWGTDTLKVDFP